MSWQPVSEESLWDEMNAAWGRMSLRQRRLWDAVRIIPEKWQQQPYGELGGGFWVVGILGKHVLWFNDIEEGFNVSRYTKYGVIEEYWCNQDSLEDALHAFTNLIETGEQGVGKCGPPLPL